MRLKKTEVEAREQFVREFFKANQGATVAKANEAVKEKFGKMMRAVRMYELRAEVEPAEVGKESPDPAPAEPAVQQ